jgi:hypothetical protein
MDRKASTPLPGQATGGIIVEEMMMPEEVRIRVLPDGRLTREDAAKYLGRKPKTLAMWHLQRKGPPSILVAGRRSYFKQVLDAFIRGER